MRLLRHAQEPLDEPLDKGDYPGDHKIEREHRSCDHHDEADGFVQTVGLDRPRPSRRIPGRVGCWPLGRVGSWPLVGRDATRPARLGTRPEQGAAVRAIRHVLTFIRVTVAPA